jgi:nucleotide-binding universal stress UspA family protein
VNSHLHIKDQAIVTASGVKCNTTMRRGVAYKEIIREAETIAPNLIVVGTQGIRGLVPFLMGSTAVRVLRHAPCPVLVAWHGQND